jgi:hypothetical protein
MQYVVVGRVVRVGQKSGCLLADGRSISAGRFMSRPLVLAVDPLSWARSCATLPTIDSIIARRALMLAHGRDVVVKCWPLGRCVTWLRRVAIVCKMAVRAAPEPHFEEVRSSKRFAIAERWRKHNRSRDAGRRRRRTCGCVMGLSSRAVVPGGAMVLVQVGCDGAAPAVARSAF